MPGFAHKNLAAALALAVALGASGAQAATLTDLFNSGVDGSNVALVGGQGVTDTHYQIVSSTTTPGLVGQQAVTYYNNAYVGEDADSRWLAATAIGGPVNDTTVFRLTFDLTGFNPATAMLSGTFGSDNSAQIFLNGVGTSNFSLGFGALTAFSLTSGFVSGLNTFDIALLNGLGPGAFRVDDFIGSADLAAPGGVPEPATWAMMLMGFFGLGAALRTSRRRALTFG